MNLTAWTPKSVLSLRDYNGKKFGADLAAGVTVGLVALPLSMAFAIASGAPPEAGGGGGGLRPGAHAAACGAREQPARLMAQASFAQHVGEENICPHVSAAIERARAVHAQDLAREVLT